MSSCSDSSPFKEVSSLGADRRATDGTLCEASSGSKPVSDAVSGDDFPMCPVSKMNVKECSLEERLFLLRSAPIETTKGSRDLETVRSDEQSELGKCSNGLADGKMPSMLQLTPSVNVDGYDDLKSSRLKGCPVVSAHVNGVGNNNSQPSTSQESTKDLDRTSDVLPNRSDGTHVMIMQANDIPNGEPLSSLQGLSVEDPLRIFHVLDEYNISEDDASDNEGEEEAESSESDISDTEVEKMLENGLKDGIQDDTNEKNDAQFTRRSHITIEELGHNHFEVLPEGWIRITHRSGIPLYLHRSSRVCTFARPYFLGQGSARKHQVPLSAIPCLQYRKRLDEEKAEKERQASLESGQPLLKTAKIETAEENKTSQSLGIFAIQQYCRSLFRFKRIRKLKFENWEYRRRYSKARRQEKDRQRPSLPGDTKLIKFPLQDTDDPEGKNGKREWILNPNGKSYICILHEYVQHALKKQPIYEFKALENPSTPYSAAIKIDGMEYGVGSGSSKKLAKLAAAKSSLEILIPEMREKIRNDDKKTRKRPAGAEEEDSLSIFDTIKIEDPRVAEFCTKTTEPSPFAILLTCLQRNFDSKTMPINYKVNPLPRQSIEFTMTVGSHSARVVCRNKKDGKQRASQAILQKLHPYINSWGSLLRLYGNRSMRNVKERKQEEQEITMLQSKASLNSPNYAILEKLKSEMSKLHEKENERKPIGVFIPPLDVSLPSSGTQLNKVDL